MTGPSASQPLPPRDFGIETAHGRAVTGSHWPAVDVRRGALCFSHGAQSAPQHYAALLSAWAAMGFDVWAPLHVDSAQHPLTAQYPGMASWRARIEDMHALSNWLAEPYVSAGHSYGALTALVLGGAQGDHPEGMSGTLTDPRARCVVALSPPPPIPGLITPEGYAAIGVPALVQTGTLDAMPGWPDPDWRVHRPAYDCAPAGGDRYLLVLEGVDHTFGGAICEHGAPEKAQNEQLETAIEASGLFLRAHSGPADSAAQDALHARLSYGGPFRLEHK